MHASTQILSFPLHKSLKFLITLKLNFHQSQPILIIKSEITMKQSFIPKSDKKHK